MVTITRFEDVVAGAAGLALPRAQHQEMVYLVDEALNQPFSLTGYTVCRRLAALFPERTVLQVADFDPEEYARDGQCALHLAEIPFAETLTWWHDPAQPLKTALQNAWLQIDWRGHHLEALQLSWIVGGNEITRYFLIAADKGVAERFYAAACAWKASSCRVLSSRRSSAISPPSSMLAPPTSGTGCPGRGASCSSARPATARPTR